MAELYGERLTVIATASMTNMAEWIQAHREAALRTGTIAVMGGALTVPGNVNPLPRPIPGRPGGGKIPV